MKKVEKTELICNIITCLLSIALTVFIFKYELYAMEQFSKEKVAEGLHPIGAAGIIVYIFFYIPFGALFTVLAVFMFLLSLELKGLKKKRNADFGFIQPKPDKTKRRILFILLILKGIAAALSCFFIFVTFDAAYSTVISKTVYCIALVVYTLSFLLTFVNRKKMIEKNSNHLS